MSLHVKCFLARLRARVPEDQAHNGFQRHGVAVSAACVSMGTAVVVRATIATGLCWTAAAPGVSHTPGYDHCLPRLFPCERRASCPSRTTCCTISLRDGRFRDRPGQSARLEVTAPTSCNMPCEHVLPRVDVCMLWCVAPCKERVCRPRNPLGHPSLQTRLLHI